MRPHGPALHVQRDRQEVVDLGHIPARRGLDLHVQQDREHGLGLHPERRSDERLLGRPGDQRPAREERRPGRLLLRRQGRANRPGHGRRPDPGLHRLRRRLRARALGREGGARSRRPTSTPRRTASTSQTSRAPGPGYPSGASRDRSTTPMPGPSTTALRPRTTRSGSLRETGTTRPSARCRWRGAATTSSPTA